MATDATTPESTTPPAAPGASWGIAWGGAMLIVLALGLRAFQRRAL